jgi:hypothetical protein
MTEEFGKIRKMHQPSRYWPTAKGCDFLVVHEAEE